MLPELKHEMIDRYSNSILKVSEKDISETEDMLETLFSDPITAKFVHEAVERGEWLDELTITPQQAKKVISLIMGDHFQTIKNGVHIHPYVFMELVIRIESREISSTQAKSILGYIFEHYTYVPNPPKVKHEIPRSLSEMYSMLESLGVTNPWDVCNAMLKPWESHLGPEDQISQDQWSVLMRLLERLQSMSEPKFNSARPKDYVQQIEEAKNKLGIVKHEQDAVKNAIDKVFEIETDAIAKVLSGNDKPFGRIFGETMKILQGNANPEEIRNEIRNRLDRLRDINENS